MPPRLADWHNNFIFATAAIVTVVQTRVLLMKKINFIICFASIIGAVGCPSLDEIETRNKIIYVTDTDSAVCSPVENSVSSDGNVASGFDTVVQDEKCVQKIMELDSALEEALDDIQCDYDEYLGLVYGNEMLQRQFDGLNEKYHITRNKLWVICDEYCSQTKVCDCKKFFESSEVTDTDTSAE